MAYSGDYRPNPSSAEGQIESIGSFSAGLSHLSGWRREAARWFVLALLMVPMMLFVVSALMH